MTNMSLLAEHTKFFFFHSQHDQLNCCTRFCKKKKIIKYLKGGMEENKHRGNLSIQMPLLTAQQLSGLLMQLQASKDRYASWLVGSPSQRDHEPRREGKVRRQQQLPRCTDRHWWWRAAPRPVSSAPLLLFTPFFRAESAVTLGRPWAKLGYCWAERWAGTWGL